MIQSVQTPSLNKIRLHIGHVLLHPGHSSNGGAPITNGVRYVLVCFIVDKTIMRCYDLMKQKIFKQLVSASKHYVNTVAFGKLQLKRQHEQIVQHQ